MSHTDNGHTVRFSTKNGELVLTYNASTDEVDIRTSAIGRITIVPKSYNTISVGIRRLGGEEAEATR